MAIAITLENYLNSKGVTYDVITHPKTQYSMETAASAHIPGDQLAKSVILEDEQGYLMAIIPSTHHVEIGKLHKLLNRQLGLATEQELKDLLPDCDVGAVPALGNAYGIETIIDDSLTGYSDIYFESGSHREVVHLNGETFQKLLKNAKHASFSRHI
jgi:Ala-tRNA(Pro) deacylase